MKRFYHRAVNCSDGVSPSENPHSGLRAIPRYGAHLSDRVFKRAAKPQAHLFQLLAKGGIEFITMTVAFADLAGADAL